VPASPDNAGKAALGPGPVLRNADAAILADAAGRQVYQARDTRHSDDNHVTGSLRQPGSAMTPLVYLAAFHQGLDLDTWGYHHEHQRPREERHHDRLLRTD
jgi:membrane peptidoglycan carboxypeptidase